MTSYHVKAALLVMAPMFLSGCMISGYTYMSAVHPDPLYRNDKIKSAEKAVQTPDGKLVVLFNGKMAGSSKSGPFMVSIQLRDPKVLPTDRDPSPDLVFVPRSAIIEGWHLPEEHDLLPISVVFPVILPAHEDPFNVPDKFPGLKDSERTLYVTWNEKHDINAQLVYVVKDSEKNKTFYCLDEWKKERSHNYPLFFCFL
jgi:hypothetical protein